MTEKRMIEGIYDELRELGATTSRTDFSETWLGMEGSYYRGRRHTDGTVSTEALLTCAVRLKERARLLKDRPLLHERATRFEVLANSCFDHLLARGRP